MKKLIRFIAVALFVGAMVSPAMALQIGEDPTRGFSNRILTAVLNNSASTLTSGSVVIWDTTSTNADSTLGAYVNTTTSADSALVAGVTLSDSILSGGVGTIVVYGPAYTRVAGTTDLGTNTVGTAMGTTTLAGQAGNGSRLGVQMETMANSDSGGNADDNKLMIIFVNPNNA